MAKDSKIITEQSHVVVVLIKPWQSIDNSARNILEMKVLTFVCSDESSLCGIQQALGID